MPARKQKKAGKKAGANLVKQAHGGAIHQGTPGKIVPGPGRPKDEFKELCRGLVSHTVTLEQAAEILQDHTDAKFVAILRALAEYGYGKPTEISLDDILNRLTEQAAAIRALLEPEQADELLERLTPIWE